MSRKQWMMTGFGLALLLVIGLVGLTFYFETLPERVSQHETLVLGQTQLTPGSTAALRVAVRDSRDGAPQAAAKINVMLQAADGAAETVYSGATNELGTADVQFAAPDTAVSNYTLIVETESDLGSDRVERPLTLQRDYRILLTTDKPLYQPGQIIHLRALALSTFDLTPAAAQPLDIRIADGKGNTVFRDSLTTTDFGVAFTDFQLAGEVNTGAYKITATMGDTSTEQTVTVERYVLPKFDVNLATERPYYQPGERVQGSLNSAYFYGKPVSGAEITLEGFTYDFERVDAFTLQGETNADGSFNFEFQLPDFIAGSDLEGGLGAFYLQAQVTDAANQTEGSSLSFPVTDTPIIIEAMPESGEFRTGVENILYVLTSTPDGAPLPTTLTVDFWLNNETVTVETGPFGLAEIPYTPQEPYQELRVTAVSANGASAARAFTFDADFNLGSVLLRSDRPVYRVGDTMELTILSAESARTAYVDIIREGQTVSTRAVPLADGQAQLAVDLSPDLFGTLELHAYVIPRDGRIQRDTRLVIVEQANDLALSFSSDQDEYRPGETAVLDIQVNDETGSGQSAAVGLAIVDESVFALAEQDPGFAKLYFILEQALLQPKYDLHGFSIPDLMLTEPLPEADAELLAAQEGAAQASLAEASRTRPDFSLTANSRDDNLARIAVRQESYFNGLSSGLLLLWLLVPVGLLLLTGALLRREKQLWRSLGIALGAIVGLIALGFTGLWTWLFEWIFWRGDEAALLLLGLGVLALIGLTIIAIRRKDASLGGTVGLLLLFVGLLAAIAYAADRASQSPDDAWLIAAVAALSLLPLALLARGIALVRERRWGTAVLLAYLSFMTLLLPLAAVASLGMGGMAMAVQEEVIFDEANMAFAEAPRAAEAAGEAAATTPAGEPPRLRQFFPETMLWLPDGVTDANGRLTLDVPVADSITTWRLTALASTQNGRLGSGVGSLRVFQDFFIDLNLPQALTVGDEISVPVGVFNYLPDAQTVTLTVEPDDWYTLLDEPSKTIEIGGNDITVVYFRIRAQAFGERPFQVTAIGSQMSDAIRKTVRVFPNGKEIRSAVSDRLTPEQPVRQTVTIPADAITGTQQLTVKIYPGVVSQVVEGLDSMLRMPNGCFEQTSSSTYPNVLVLDYLQTTEQASPEVQFKAEDYINIGYQRLTTFEVDGGGFSLFGSPPADRMLTAYGLQEFADMSRVHDVDPALIDRAARWLLNQQQSDGSWENDSGLVHESTWQNLGNDRLPVTAYIVWSLIAAGFGDEPGVRLGVDYLRTHAVEAEDAYVLALLANALTADAAHRNVDVAGVSQEVLDRLAALAIPQGDGVVWRSGVASFIGSEGQTGSIETTALAALAFLRAQVYTELTNQALTALIQQKDSFGTWYSTQSTILTLKALLATLRSGAENVNATVTVTVNGRDARTVTVTPENFDVVQLLTFDDVRLDENEVTLDVAGEGNLMYQITSSSYLPWAALPAYPELVDAEELVTIDVAYDRTELAVDESVTVDVTVTLNEVDGRADWALIDLGIPPGFDVNAEDLNGLVAQYQQADPDADITTIERFELTGRQVLVYLGNLAYGEPFSFSYRLTAKFPLRAQTPASSAYDYYNPDVNGEAQPQNIVVVEQRP